MNELISTNPISVLFKGKYCENFDVFLYDYPVVTSANSEYKEISIPGRIGSVIIPIQSTKNIRITCTFAILNKRLLPNVRQLKEWLDGQGELYLTEEMNVYYDVLFVEHGDVERELRSFGRFTVTFICYPYGFDETGKQPHSIIDNTLYNSYAECLPEYIINGEGTCKLSVNGNEMTANIGQNLIINTRLMIPYRKDGILKNTSISGNYKDMKLNSGTNKISITEGFDLKIIPHWGWKA